MDYLFKGLCIGLLFGVPVGAVGALTVRRTLAYGKAAGFLSGLGCSAADLCYCCISMFGFTLVSSVMLRYQNFITLLGGALLVLMGLGFLKSKRSAAVETAGVSKLFSFFVSSFLIAISNPATIVTFLLAFSIFNIGEIHAAFDGACTVFGIVTGTCIWWTLISLGLGNIRTRITPKTLTALDRLLGILVLLFGAAVLLQSIHAFWA